MLPISALRSSAFLPLALLLVVCAGSLPAAAQSTPEVRSLSDRMDRLSRDLTALQQQVYNGRAPSGGTGGADMGGAAYGQLDSRISQLETQMRDMTGQLEEVNFNLGQVKQRLDRLSSDVDFRLSQLEKGGAPTTTTSAAAPGQVEAPAGTAAPGLAPGPRNLGTINRDPAPGVNPPPAAANTAAGRTQTATATTGGKCAATGAAVDQYEFAFDMLRKADYPGAETCLRSFVQNFPSDKLAGNAQYWLGETFYVRNNFQEAAVQFLQGYQKYPQSPKAADNLLKLGLSLENIGKKVEACAAFGRFDKEYPTASGTLKRRVAEERQRLSCT